MFHAPANRVPGCSRNKGLVCFIVSPRHRIQCLKNVAGKAFSRELVKGEIGILDYIVQDCDDALGVVGHRLHDTQRVLHVRTACLVDLTGVVFLRDRNCMFEESLE